MKDFRTTDNRLIRIQDGGPALIRAGVLLNPQYAADRIKGADLVIEFAKTGDVIDHAEFFLKWVASAPAPRLDAKAAGELYREREAFLSDQEEAPALGEPVTTEFEHPGEPGTVVQRTRYPEGNDTLSIFHHDRQLSVRNATDLDIAAGILVEMDNAKWPNSLTVLGDPGTFFIDWAMQFKSAKAGRRTFLEAMWLECKGNSGKPPKSRQFGRFLSSNLEMETQLELVRAKGKNNVITVLHRGNALDNDDHDQWKRGAVIIKDLHDKNDAFYDGFTMFRDWSLQDYTPEQAERWEETVKRVYEVAAVQAPHKGVIMTLSGSMSAAGPHAYSPPCIKSSLVDDAVLLAEAGTARMVAESVNIETMARKCAELERRLAQFTRPAADGPQVGETWWCLMPTKSRNTLQKMTITYISDKRVELLITGRQNTAMNLASYRRDDVEFVEVVQ